MDIGSALSLRLKTKWISLQSHKLNFISSSSDRAMAYICSFCLKHKGI